MAPLDPHVAVAERTDRVSVGARAEQIGQREIGSPIAPFAVERGLERREQRSAAADVIANLPAVLIRYVRRVRNQQRAIPAERLRPQVVFVNEVEEESSFEQRVIQSLQVFRRLRALCAAPVPRSAARSIESNRPLRVQDRDVGHRPRVAEVRLVRGEPGEEVSSHFLPSGVFGRAAEPVEPRYHAARRRLRHPHRRLGRRLRHVTPCRPAVAVRAGDVGDRAVFHHRARDAPLLRAVPDYRVAAAPLVIRVEPARHLAEALHVLDGSNTAAEIADVHRFGPCLGDRRLPAPPHVEDAIHVGVVVLAIQGTGRIGAVGRHTADLLAVHLVAALAVTDSEIAGARPAIGEKAVDRISRVELAIDRRHLVGEIRAEHARLVQPRRFVVRARRSVAIALEPFGMGIQRVPVRVVAVHARDQTHVSRFRRSRQLAEQIARSEELAAVVIAHVGRIERDDAAAVEEQGVELQRRPVVDPTGHVERERIAFVEIQLAAAPHRRVPRTLGSGRVTRTDRRDDQRSRRCRKKFAACNHGRSWKRDRRRHDDRNPPAIQHWPPAGSCAFAPALRVAIAICTCSASSNDWPPPPPPPNAR